MSLLRQFGLMLCVSAVYFLGLWSGKSSAQTPPTIVQTTYGYPAAFILYWQVGTTPPPCGQTLPNGSPGPVLYSFAVQQGANGQGDSFMWCANGSNGTPEWVTLTTAP